MTGARPLLRRACRVPILTGVLMLAGATPAVAHIQVTPGVAAPDDPVRFSVLVPGESDKETVKVQLKVPADVLPFSYGRTPGWKRTLVEAPNGAVDRIVWTGRMAKDDFAEFSFLAGTPARPTTLVWKALQTYSDGTIVRWIGAPGSEQPAPVTRVVAGAPPQNAGGEGTTTAPGGTTTTQTAGATSGSGGDPIDWVARGLALAGVFAGLAAIVLALGSGKKRRRGR